MNGIGNICNWCTTGFACLGCFFLFTIFFLFLSLFLSFWTSSLSQFNLSSSVVVLRNINYYTNLGSIIARMLHKSFTCSRIVFGSRSLPSSFFSAAFPVWMILCCFFCFSFQANRTSCQLKGKAFVNKVNNPIKLRLFVH